MDSCLLRAIEESEEDGYLRYHAPRYDALLTLLHRNNAEGKRVLDIGQSPFTAVARDSLRTPIDTLGFGDDGETGTGFNYHFDLNDAQFPEHWRKDIPAYEVIVFSEVIEHLHTSPELVLLFLRSVLQEDGIVIIQTPNAVVLHKRMQMLFGRNPYSLISTNPRNPSHFREYTAREMTRYCQQAGLKIESATVENYFDYRYTNHVNGSFSEKKAYRWINVLYGILPASLRPGLCFVVRVAA